MPENPKRLEPIGDRLEDSRPTAIEQMAGNVNVTKRLLAQMRAGRLATRQLFTGPVGSGKTTYCQCLALWYLCKNRDDRPQGCGKCSTCEPIISGLGHFKLDEWTGEKLSRDWEYFMKNGASDLRNKDHVFFVDETQNLKPIHQEGLLRYIERARCLVLFATTHRNKLNDALVDRFTVNAYCLKRPTPEEGTDHLAKLSAQLGVNIKSTQIRRAGEALHWNLRQCVDFLRTVANDLADELVTDDYLDLMFGEQQEIGSNDSNVSIESQGGRLTF